MKLLKNLRDLIHTFLIELILHIRPLFGAPGCCRFPLSCTQYAKEVLTTNSTLRALSLITKRILHCR